MPPCDFSHGGCWETLWGCPHALVGCCGSAPPAKDWQTRISAACRPCPASGKRLQDRPRCRVGPLPLPLLRHARRQLSMLVSSRRVRSSFVWAAGPASQQLEVGRILLGSGRGHAEPLGAVGVQVGAPYPYRASPALSWCSNLPCKLAWAGRVLSSQGHPVQFASEACPLCTWRCKRLAFLSILSQPSLGQLDIPISPLHVRADVAIPSPTHRIEQSLRSKALVVSSWVGVGGGGVPNSRSRSQNSAIVAMPTLPVRMHRPGSGAGPFQFTARLALALHLVMTLRPFDAPFLSERAGT